MLDQTKTEEKGRSMCKIIGGVSDLLYLTVSVSALTDQFGDAKTILSD